MWLGSDLNSHLIWEVVLADRRGPPGGVPGAGSVSRFFRPGALCGRRTRRARGISLPWTGGVGGGMAAGPGSAVVVSGGCGDGEWEGSGVSGAGGSGLPCGEDWFI